MISVSKRQGKDEFSGGSTMGSLLLAGLTCVLLFNIRHVTKVSGFIVISGMGLMGYFKSKINNQIGHLVTAQTDTEAGSSHSHSWCEWSAG